MNRPIKCNVCITILWKFTLISIACPAYLSCLMLEPHFRVCRTLDLTIFFFGIFAKDKDFDKIPRGYFSITKLSFLHYMVYVLNCLLSKEITCVEGEVQLKCLIRNVYAVSQLFN